MLVLNKTPSQIAVNDINRVLPAMSQGPILIPDHVVAESRDMEMLARQKLIEFNCIDGTVRVIETENGVRQLVPGIVLWHGEGATKPVNQDVVCPGEISNDVDVVMKYIRQVKKGLKRYRIARRGFHTVFISSVNCVLDAMNPSFIVSESQFQSVDVQQALAGGVIEVQEIMESSVDDHGQVVWKKVESSSGEYAPGYRSPGPDDICCFWEGPIYDAGGYANMNRQYVFNLNDMGVFAKPASYSTLMDVEEEVRHRLNIFSSMNIPISSPKVFATNVPSNHVGHSIAYTMMETESRVHPHLAKAMAPSDELWVPSEWNKETFAAGGVDKEIFVMPLGVDTQAYAPRPPSLAYLFTLKKFVFLSVFNWNWRKGFDVMLRAYAQAFTADDDVSLIMVSRYVGQSGGMFLQRIYDDIKAIKEIRGNDLPHLVLINAVIPTCVMPFLYNSADAFVLFSRGEGWGLPYCEAAASKLPVIGAYHGGQKMFLNDENSLLVTPDVIRKGDKSINCISPFYPTMDFVDYSQTAIDEAADKMRYAVSNREDMALRAEKAYNLVTREFTWKRAAERVAARLRELHA